MLGIRPRLGLFHAVLYQFYSFLSLEISRHQAEKAQVGLVSLMLCPEVMVR